MRTEGLNLVMPDKADPERDLVADSWVSRGGTVTRLGRFWDAPELDRASVRIYANDTFALVLAQKLNLHLVCPDDDLLVRLLPSSLGRRVRIASLADAQSLTYPIFVKPIVPKQFRASVYESWAQLEAECVGLDAAVQIYESEIVHFEAEVRGFILHGQIQDAALYQGSASLSEAVEFLSAIAPSEHFPATCVLDVGHIRGRGWAVIEANASWGAGLNGCKPDNVIGCIAHASHVAV